MLVGVGGFVFGGVEGAPVAAVVGGDVGAVGAYGDPGAGGGVVGHGAAEAVGWGGGGEPVLRICRICCSSRRLAGMQKITADHDGSTHVLFGIRSES